MSLTMRKVGMFCKKNAPTIISVASAGGVVVTGVLAARGAYKSTGALDKHKEDMTALRANKEQLEDKEYNKEVFDRYKELSVEFVKSYWPAVVAGGLSIAGIISSNKIMQKRCMAFAALYTGATTAFKEYQKRVAERYGEEAEFELRTGVKKNEVVEVTTDKKGNEKTKVTVVTEANPSSNYDGFILIDKKCPYWREDNPEMTYFYILQQQKMFTQLLHSRGYVFLNEVREAFGLDATPEGQLIGWVYEEDDPQYDNCIDFGLREGTENYDFFMNGKNEFVYLDMNHDGIIYEKFPQFTTLRRRYNAGRI